MIIHKKKPVELTKIHYYETPRHIPTISREIFDNQINTDLVIEKKNTLFGHKWILKINEISTSSSNNSKLHHWRFTLLILLIISTSFVVALGVFFTFHVSKTNKQKNQTFPVRTITHESVVEGRKFCTECSHNSSLFVCLKQSEMGAPKCVEVRDRYDPTGCGGFCTINTHFCQLLDAENGVFQCSELATTLKCAEDAFNCGNRCIRLESKCDGIVHCSNKSDELNCECNLETHFWCTDRTSCLNKSKKCDGIVDCFDKSDEMNCKNSQCSKNGKIPCRNGECIQRDEFCDGIQHCSDLSDEPAGCQTS